MDYNDIEIAKRLEANNEWSAAADAWNKINRIQDANSCKRIANAVYKGDRYREDCAVFYGEYKLGLITKETYTKEIAILYKKHFN